MRGRAVLAALAAGVALVSTGATAPAQQTDACPEVVYLATVEAAPQAAMLNQGQDVPVPAAYARVEHETSPAFTYAEAGSASFGLLEGMEVQPRDVVSLLTGFIPVPLPEGLVPDLPDTDSPFAIPTPPGRATAAHPAESIPERDAATWGSGRSEARASATEAHAATLTTGASGSPVGGSTAVVTSTLDCERLELHATWSLDTVGPGASSGSIRQELRAVLDGEGVPEVDVVTVAGDESLGGALWELPVGPLSDFFEAFGQGFEVQEPEVEVGPGLLRVRSNPILWSMNNPSGPQRIELAAGHLLVDARYLGLAPDLEVGGPLAGGETTAAGDDVPPGGAAVGSGPAGSGATAPSPPPEPTDGSTDAVGLARIGSDGRVIDLLDPVSSWGWLVTVSAALAGAWAWWRLALAKGEQWPTAAWTFRLVDRRTERFRAAFLRW